MKDDMHDHRQPDKLDRLLDSGLERYSRSEPLAGLEDRILARLELAAERGDAPWFTWERFGWALAALLLAVGIGFGIYLTTGPGEDVDYIAVNQEVVNVNANSPLQTKQAPLPLSIPFAQLPQFKPPFVLTIPTTPVVEVKQEVFPTPVPLSEQERLALAYARVDRRAPAAVVAATSAEGIRDLDVTPLEVTPIKIDELSKLAK